MHNIIVMVMGFTAIILVPIVKEPPERLALLITTTRTYRSRAVKKIQAFWKKKVKTQK